jgi:hypothetical protein
MSSANLIYRQIEQPFTWAAEAETSKRIPQVAVVSSHAGKRL